MAGQHVVLNTGSTANCFYAAGETVALRGSAKSAALAGDTVTIDGTVDGDVEVWPTSSSWVKTPASPAR